MQGTRLLTGHPRLDAWTSISRLCVACSASKVVWLVPDFAVSGAAVVTGQEAPSAPFFTVKSTQQLAQSSCFFVFVPS